MLLPPTTTCSLPRLPAPSHDYLLPPTTTCSLPRLPAPSHDYLLPPTTTCSLPRLAAPSHDHLKLLAILVSELVKSNSSNTYCPTSLLRASSWCCPSVASITSTWYGGTYRCTTFHSPPRPSPT